MMKKFIFWALAGCLVLAGCDKPVPPENPGTVGTVEPEPEIVAEGETGDLIWTLDEEGTLTISGEGEMPDYDWERFEAEKRDVTTAPWGKLFFSAIVIEEGVRNVGKFAFYKCLSPVSVVIPKSVTQLEDYAFHKCKELTSIAIPDAVTLIGDCALWGCEKLETVDIPDGVTSIGYAAFYECLGLKSIVIPDTVTTLGGSEGFVFGYCDNLKSVTVGNGVRVVGNHTFYYCQSLESVVLGTGVEAIGINVFQNCPKLASVTIPAAVKTIGEGTFWTCGSLTGITVEAGNTAFASEDGVLFDKAKTILMQYPAGRSAGSYNMPGSVKTVAQCAFESCKNLKSVTIADGATYISKLAFYSCTALEGIVIPDSVTGLGESAFIGCRAMKSAVLGAGVVQIMSTTFHDCDALEDVTVKAPSGVQLVQNLEHLNFAIDGDTLHVPANIKELYEADETWAAAFSHFVAI